MENESTNQNKPSAKLGEPVAQFLRFAAVGVVNSIINFTVLNILSWLTHIDHGPKVIFLVVIAFIAATSNSYYMNKHWAFKDPSTNDFGLEFSKFLMVSIVGACINSLAVYAITTHVSPMFGLSTKLWLNFANMVGIGLGLVWNFFGYRAFVFKDR